jgi:hypothetical protein
MSKNSISGYVRIRILFNGVSLQEGQQQVPGELLGLPLDLRGGDPHLLGPRPGDPLPAAAAAEGAPQPIPQEGLQVLHRGTVIFFLFL